MSKKELSVFESEIRRAKWLDDDAINLGLVSHPDIGLQKAEIITALCSMLHGPLSKINPQAYASTKSILQVISSKHHFIGLADSIAQLFVDKFKPEGKNAEGKVTSALSDSDFNKRANEISTKIGVLQFETAKTILSKMLDATKLTLRTNLYNRDRFKHIFIYFYY
jgi:glutamate dehydrogenase